MTEIILALAIILLVCLLVNKISGRLGLPMLLTFILLGMMFGSDGWLFKIPFDNYELAEGACTLSLIYIMFYGGFGTNWSHAKPVAGKAVLLSTMGVLLTAGLTGLFCYLVLHFDFWESMLVGAVISSTDAASVFAVLRLKRLNLKYNTASLLEVESGSNDPFSYMLTVLILSIMGGEATGGSLILMVLGQVVFGILAGVGVALLSRLVLSKYRFAADGFDTIFVFSMALLAYGGAAAIGGNGYLSAYIAGMMLGNRPIPNKKSLVHFFDGLTGLMQILLFFLLGLLSFPSQMPQIILPAIAVALFLTFVARPAAVFLLLSPLRCPWEQKLLVSWAGLRGAASIVFAILVTVSAVETKNDIFHFVFFIVLFSISLQGTLLPMISKRLGMIDDSSNVLKTFSDYSEEVPVQFVKLSIQEKHPWAGQRVREIDLLPGLLLVLILRGKERILPNGETTVMERDVVVLSAASVHADEGVYLTEIPIESDHEWRDKALWEIRLEEDMLIIVVKRGEKTLIPNGNTEISVGDVLVIAHL